MFPSDQLGHCHLIAMCLQLQATQDIGDKTAEFTRVQRVAPYLRQAVRTKRRGLVFAQSSSYFRLTAGHQNNEAGIFFESKKNGIIGCGITSVQGGDNIYFCIFSLETEFESLTYLYSSLLSFSSGSKDHVSGCLRCEQLG